MWPSQLNALDLIKYRDITTRSGFTYTPSGIIPPKKLKPRFNYYLNRMDSLETSDDSVKIKKSNVKVKKTVAVKEKKIERVDVDNSHSSSVHLANEIKLLKKPDINDENYSFVHKLVFNSGNTEIQGALKSTLDRDTDNLVYEYWAGMFINKYCKMVPFLTYTYALFQYKSEADVKKASKVTTQIEKFPKLKLICEASQYKKGDCLPVDICNNADRFCLMNEFISDANSYENFIMSLSKKKLSLQDKIDILGTTYMVYFTLYKLRSQFTHYDLHDENVLVTTPNNGELIKYVFNMEDGSKLEFETKYMVRIIDFGRSYFEGNSQYLEYVKKNEGCNSEDEENGENSGLDFFTSRKCVASDSWICPSKNNQSHDLRLFKLLQNVLNIFPKINVIYKDKEDFGTPFHKGGLKNKISNIMEAHDLLFDWLKENANGNDATKNIVIYEKDRKFVET